MISYRIEETINRPVQEVFPYLGDPTLHAKWMDVSDMRVTTPGEIRVGSMVQGLMKVRSRMIPFGWKVTAFQEGVSLAFRTTEGPMNWEGSYEVAATDGTSTRVIGSGRVGLKGWQRLLEPFMGGEVRRGEAAELRKLKDLLERPT
jgi:uncharacterized protein YndB with AHSA1/START domain